MHFDDSRSASMQIDVASQRLMPANKRSSPRVVKERILYERVEVCSDDKFIAVFG